MAACEVTPGYYYDTVTLRKLISTSNVIRKTAAVEDNPNRADPLLTAGGQSSKAIEKRIFLMMNFRGIEARLGWKTEKTDQCLAERFEWAQPPVSAAFWRRPYTAAVSWKSMKCVRCTIFLKKFQRLIRLMTGR